MKYETGEDMEEYARKRRSEMRRPIVRAFPKLSPPVSILQTADFILPLDPNLDGSVNLGVARGTGAATFTRATAAWTKLSSGLWAKVGSGVARACYTGMNTVVTPVVGYFPEAAGTQLVTPTASIRDMTDGSWVATTMTVAKTGTGIDGVANACSRLTATGNGATLLHVLVAAASSRTYSAWIRRVSGIGTVKLVQNATKTADLAGSINSVTYTRVQLNANVDVTTNGYGIELGTSGDVIEVDFNQFEAGSIATSPMDAAGAARNADTLTYPSAGNATAAQGTIYAETSIVNSAPTTPYVFTISDGTTNNRITCFVNGVGSTVAYRITSGGASQLSGTGTGGVYPALSVIAKQAMSWSSASGRGFLNGATDITVGAITAPASFTTIGIGVNEGGTTNQTSGIIKNVRIWQSQLTDGAGQSITT